MRMGPGGPGMMGPGGGWFGRHGYGMGFRGPGMMGPGMMGPGMMGPGMMGPVTMNPGSINPAHRVSSGLNATGPCGPWGIGPWRFGPGRGPGGCFGWGRIGHPRGWFGGWFGLYKASNWYPGFYHPRALPYYGTGNKAATSSNEFADPIPRKKGLIARFRDWYAYNFWH